MQKIVIQLTLIGGLWLLAAAAASAIGSQNYLLPWLSAANTSAASQASAGAYGLRVSVGAVNAGSATSAGYRVSLGYGAGMGQATQRSVFLPVALR